MNIRNLIKGISALSLTVAVAGLVQPATAANCPGFPSNQPANVNRTAVGCGVTSVHRANVNPKNVIAVMLSNTSGAGRRASTRGLNNGTPIAGCFQADESPNGGANPQVCNTPLAINGMRINIETL